MAKVYSTRFAQCAGSGMVATYIVPPGKRAVVMTVCWGVQSGTDSSVWVGAAGVYPFVQRVPGSPAGGSQALRLVCYAGEQLVLSTIGANVGAHLSGYLFDDVSGGLSADLLPDIPPEVPPPGKESIQ